VPVCNLELELGQKHGKDELDLQEGEVLPEAKPVTGIEGWELILAGLGWGGVGGGGKE
jgi:hypothetical protein